MSSRRNYTVFNDSTIQVPVKNQLFNESKLNELLKKRKNNFQSMRKTKSIENDIQVHLER